MGSNAFRTEHAGLSRIGTENTGSDVIWAEPKDSAVFKTEYTGSFAYENWTLEDLLWIGAERSVYSYDQNWMIMTKLWIRTETYWLNWRL